MAADTMAGGATGKLSAFVHGARFDDLGAATRHAAHRAFVNIIGCCVGGAGHDITSAAARALLPVAGAGAATILGRNERADILTATLLNCVSSAAYSFDDTHALTILHPAGAVACALLAVAEQQPMTGREFLLAFILGVDVASRLSKTVSVAPAIADIAWSQTGIAAGVGAAAAAAKAYGLDPQGIASAIGIAALQASGFREAIGTMSGTLIFGHAAQSGLRAALFARAGMTGPAAPLEGKHGYARLFSRQPHLDYLTEELGVRFEVEALAYKPYPCGIVIHPALDAALAWHHAQAGGIGEFERVLVEAHPAALALANRRHPAGVLDAKVSLHHWVAAALVYGRASLAEGRQQALDDPAIIRNREKIDVRSDDTLTPEAARMTIFAANGERQCIAIQQCKGSVANPMTDQDLNDKFHGQVQLQLPPAAASALLAGCWSLEELDDVAGLVRLCTLPRQ